MVKTAIPRSKEENMEFEDMIFSKEEGIAIITLNRPPVNAMRYQTYAELEKAAAFIAADGEFRAVIITGSGRAFCSGADVRAFYELRGSVFNVREYNANAGSALRKTRELEMPVIGAANGMALGGGLELLCVCDFRIASENATFGQPEINLGIIPGTGGTVELPYIVGLAKAKEMIMLGRIYNAKEALEMGLVNKVVPLANLLQEAKALAKELVSKPIAALKAAKLMLNTGMNMDWASARKLESEVSNWIMMTKDAQEGFLSFLEKRKPEFKGEEMVESIKKGMTSKRET
jgi:enoyl-CoA hydratase